jgi:2-polyprenyl-6-methoxyphenol hydroxylase-like FAD-dependent oxidoreductase/catechol 2,3-dioxygenase-like lactoylglutathione lyase family enzyme
VSRVVVDYEAPVAIVGGGPVGMALAIDLALRGVRSLVLELRSEAQLYPARANLTNVRSMEHFRRWGIADALRENDTVSDEVLRDVAFVTRLNGFQIERFARAYEWDERLPIASEVAEWAPHGAIEKTLREKMASRPEITVLFDHQVDTFTQDDWGVDLQITTPDGAKTARADYIVLADGGKSRLRGDVLNLRMEGHPGIARSFLWHFRAPGFSKLWKATPMSSMLLFYNEDRAADSLVPQSGTEEWAYFSSPVPEHVDGDDWEAVRAMLFRAVGEEFEVEPLSGGTFITNTLQVPRYDLGRAFLIGDAAHLVSPMGGMGMNIGIGDAADLGWKFAAVIDGWGGPMLLPSYGIERGEAARFILAGCEANQAVGARELVRPGVEEDGPAGEAARAQVAESIGIQKARQFKRMGGTLGYRYSSSPVIVRDDIYEPEATFEDYIPSASPGNRAPHAWLADGSSLFDHFGQGFTLLVLGDFDSAPMLAAAATRRIPLEVFEPGDADRASLRELYNANAAIVRTEHHVAWRGDEAPADPGRVLDVISGWGSTSNPNVRVDAPRSATAGPKVTGLGHFGIYVRDVEKMREFYTDFLGMTVTDRDDKKVFLSAQPDVEHHELLLAQHDSKHTDPQQMSFVVDSLADLREFYARIVEREYEIDHVSNHGNAIGCYFRDPEGNRVEVYWHTGVDWPQPHSDRIDLSLSESDIRQILRDMVAAGSKPG